MAAGEQGLVGEDQVHRDGYAVGAGLAGDPLDEGVGHDLAAGARVAGGSCLVGDPTEGRPDRHALGDREQRGQLRHRVRGRTQGDAALGLGAGVAVDDGLRVGLGDEPPDLGGQPSVAPSVERVAAVRAPAGGPVVDLGPVGAGEAGGLARDDRGPPFRQCAVVECGLGVRELGERVGEAEQSAAACGGLAPCVGDQRGDVTSPLGGGYAGLLVAGADCGVELTGQASLQRRRAALLLLEDADRVDELTFREFCHASF